MPARPLSTTTYLFVAFVSFIVVVLLPPCMIVIFIYYLLRCPVKLRIVSGPNLVIRYRLAVLYLLLPVHLEQFVPLRFYIR